MLAPTLTCATSNKGCIVLYGILKEQVKEVERTYLQWFRIRFAREQEG